MMELGGDGNVMASSATLSALQPGTLEELGISVKPWRRASSPPPPAGCRPTSASGGCGSAAREYFLTAAG